MKHAHDMRFGAALLGNGAARFRLWAPGEARVMLNVDGVLRVEWPLEGGARLRQLAHFGAAPVTVPPTLPGVEVYSDGVHEAGGGTLRLEPGAVHVLLVRADG